MKRFEVLTHEEPGLVGPYRARLVALAGLPAHVDGIIALGPGVERGVPVVVISQTYGDDRTGGGSQLQAILPKHARAFAEALLAAAEAAEPTPCAICAGSGKVSRPSFADPGRSALRDCASCRGTGSLFRPGDLFTEVPSAEDLQESKE